MDYEKKYNDALERAKAYHRNELAGSKKEMMEYIFPELAESEDERIRRTLVEYFGPKVQLDFVRGVPIQKIRDWLEKQKGDKDELVYRLNGLMQDYIKEGKDDEEKEHRFKCYQLFWDALEDTNFFEQKEQKQTDLPAGFYYIDLNGNRYYSKEFRYGDMKLKVGEQKPAWSEDIIRKAIKEVGLTQHQIDWFKTNVFPPKQEWSENDERMLADISWAIRYCAYDDKKKKRVHDWFINRLESLRPPFRPSEEQMNALNFAITYFMHETNCKNPTELRELYEQLKKL